MTEQTIGHDIQNVILEDQMKKAYLDYSMSVIVSRALPDVRDGLKPVHRRILYGMQELGLSPDKPHRKSARLVGDVMGKYHPHGDSSIYDAVVRLAQDFNIRYPLADGQGNFGSMDGDSAAAMRYTEVRMTKLALEMLRDLNKNTVDFMPNFDESDVEPTVLPSRFPNLLVNGSSGIAVGMATNMAPHNMNEVIQGVVEYMKNEDITIGELMKTIKGPDFPTGAFIMGKAGIKSAYETGRGKVKVRARAEIEPFKSRHQIIITEIPYQVNKSNLIIKIADLVKEKKIEGISDIRDESNRNGVRIVIDVKRDANPNVVLNHLYQNTQLQITFGIINLALVNGVPKILNLKELIQYYVEHQREIVTRRTQFDLEKAEARVHIIEGLKVAIDNIDEIISIVRSYRTDDEIKGEFTKRFGLTDIQGQAILDMRIKRLSGLQVEKLEAEYQELLALIKKLKEILSNKETLDGVIIEEMEEIRENHGDLRRTVIMPDEGEFDVESMIQEEDVVITLTNSGYIKRMPEGTYKPQKRGGQGISAMSKKEDDFVTELFITSTHDTLLFFTNTGRVYKLRAYEVPNVGRNAKGTAIINLLDLEEGEKVASIIPVSNVKETDKLVLMTKKGYVKSTEFGDYSNIRKSGIIAMGLHEDDIVVGSIQTNGEQELMAVTKKGMAIRFSENDVRTMGRTAKGVIGIRLEEEDEVVSFVLVDENKTLAVFSSNGYGKRTNLDSYKLQNRGGKGLITYKIKEKTGDVVSAKMLDESDEVMMITENGTIIRFKAEAISLLGRSTSGVKLMNIKDSQLVAVASYIGEE
ncbi:DNA gyrase subunit A [Peptoniphilus sp. KCTC 25270]|uniref:DNA gyrase subunit A n=1 Tax=Peptoniphilus sp. KCTC 25270 TaxID=2897414 RepID=UPI001E5FB023|nr:DNA gyrase subunit A [Peptoniphilus sp. KCTC 25270]MCD1147916.1 DNA gyrase subunit A [Peptoniphilus sp. KCTC 25270]